MPLPIKIFRAGRHVSASGETITFTEADLDGIVRSYDPAVHEAPLVVGHPKDNHPAFGWVSSIRRKGNDLEIDPRQVDPSFAEAVRSGRYKKVSASFYRPDSPSNPKKGSFYLRHVGFLGAAAPAVKGLGDVQFRDQAAAEHLIEIEFAEEAPAAGGEQAPAGNADKKDDAAVALEAVMAALPEWVPQALREAIQKSLGELLAKSDATPSGDAPVDNAEARRLDARARELDARDKEIRRRERVVKRSQWTQFIEALRQDGRILPMKDERVLSFLELLDAAPAGTVSFGEGETRTPVEIFQKDFLARIPRGVHFDELARGTGESGEESGAELGRRAADYAEEMRAKGIFVSASDAVAHVQREKGRDK